MFNYTYPLIVSFVFAIMGIRLPMLGFIRQAYARAVSFVRIIF